MQRCRDAEMQRCRDAENRRIGEDEQVMNGGEVNINKGHLWTPWEDVKRCESRHDTRKKVMHVKQNAVLTLTTSTGGSELFKFEVLGAPVGPVR
jgi:hypothetical protein